MAKKSDDPVPSINQMYRPALQLLIDGNIKSVSEMIDLIINEMNLDPSIKSICRKSDNRPLIKDRLQHTYTDLKKTGLVEYPGKPNKALRRITKLGRKIIEDNIDNEALKVMVRKGVAQFDEAKNKRHEYDPMISTEKWVELLRNEEIFSESGKTLLEQIISLGNKTTSGMLAEKFGGIPGDYERSANELGKAIHEATDCPLNQESEYWSILFVDETNKDDEENDGEIFWTVRPELEVALKSTASYDQNDSSNGDDFLSFLEMKGLCFDQSLVEDFLLSLKSKQFLILSGGTGTGKTRLAKAYGEYISQEKTERSIDVNVKIGKSKENGFTLERKPFFSILQKEHGLDGQYRFSIGEVEGKCRITMCPRFSFLKDDSNDKVYEKMEELQKRSEYTTLKIWLPRSEIEKRYSIIPVGSNWNDNRHIIGYRNVISGEYVRTQSLDLIQSSEKNPMDPYLLILDEMNLSHVERYMSDIISSMESEEPIILEIGEGVENQELRLGKNLFIVGTVNMDETTNMFSPKVLDRANVLEFKPVSIDKYLEGSFQYDRSKNIDFLQDCLDGIECRDMKAIDVVTAISSVENNQQIVTDIQTIMKKVQEYMNEMKLPFGFRTVDEVYRFLYVSWKYEGGNEFHQWERYLDSQIKQKILPKIHGNYTILNGLKNLQELCKNNSLNNSDEKLKTMLEVLKNQRYVSFNC